VINNVAAMITASGNLKRVIAALIYPPGLICLWSTPNTCIRARDSATSKVVGSANSISLKSKLQEQFDAEQAVLPPISRFVRASVQ
jgi:hypothetical protein